MKYLDSKPFNIALSDAVEHRPQVVEKGGPATTIPEDAKCPSGRHNTRLTECWCASFKKPEPDPIAALAEDLVRAALTNAGYRCK